MEKLQGLFELLDGASGPATKIREALEKLHEVASNMSDGPLSEMWEKAGEGGRRLLDTLAEVGEAAIEVAKKIAEVGLEGLEQILDASEEKRKALAGLAITDGDANAAAVLGSLKEIAEAAGQSDDEIVKLYKSLRLAGESADTAKDVIKAALDVKAVGSEESANAITELLKKSAATGAFKLEGRQMKNLGIPEEAIAEALKSVDKYSHMTTAQIEAALKAGKVSAADGTKALLEAVNQVYDKGAGLGAKGQEILGGSFSGSLQRIKDILVDLVENIDLSPIVDGLKTFADILKGPEGVAAAKELGQAVGSMMKEFASLATPQNLHDLVALLGVLVGWVKTVVDWTMALVNIFRAELNTEQGQAAIADLIHVLQRLWTIVSAIPWGTIFKALVDAIIITVDFVAKFVDGLIDVFQWVGEHWELLGAILIGPFVLLGAAVTAVVGWLVSAWDDIAAWFESLPGKVYDFGASIVDGLWSGIKAAWASMLKAFSDLVDMLPDAVKKVLGIASPSKVMMQLGEFAGEGFNIGVENSMNDNALSAGYGGGVSVNVEAPKGGSGGGGGAPIFNLNIVVNAAGGGGGGPTLEQIGAAAAEGARRGLADALHQMALESGALGATGTG